MKSAKPAVEVQQQEQQQQQQVKLEHVALMVRFHNVMTSWTQTMLDCACYRSGSFYALHSLRWEPPWSICEHLEHE